MNITQYCNPYTNAMGCTILEFTATDGIDNNCTQAIKFTTSLPPCVHLNRLIEIIREQGELRYQYTDTRFFNGQSFSMAINKAVQAEHTNAPWITITECASNRILTDDEFEPGYNHPVTVEMDVIKNDGQPVVINLLWRYLDGSLDREVEIRTEINPTGIGWDPVKGRFVDHQDSAQYNGYIEQYLSTLRASIAEEWQEDLDGDIAA